MKTFAACFCIIALFVAVIWESNIIVEQSGEITKLNLRPKEITTCIDYGNIFHKIYVEFNDDTTRDLKYALTSYVRYEFNKTDCKILHTHLNHKDPYDAYFNIDEFSEETCEKIRRNFKCDVTY